MPKVNVEHSSSVPSTQALGKIRTFFETDPDVRRFDPKIRCEFTEGSSSGKVIGSQIKADITVHSVGTGSKVLIIVDLPLIFAPLKGKVEALIKSKLGQYLA